MISKGKDKEENKKKREVSAEKKDSSNRGGHTIRIHVEFYKEVVLDAETSRFFLISSLSLPLEIIDCYF